MPRNIHRVRGEPHANRIQAQHQSATTRQVTVSFRGSNTGVPTPSPNKLRRLAPSINSVSVAEANTPTTVVSTPPSPAMASRKLMPETTGWHRPINIFIGSEFFGDPRRLTKVSGVDTIMLAASLQGIKSEAPRPGHRDNRKSPNAARICRRHFNSTLNTCGLRKGRTGVG